jgi:hypothetical protein
MANRPPCSLAPVVAVASIVFALAIAFLPPSAGAQTDPGVGAVSDMAPNDGIIAYLSGDKVKFTDGTQDFDDYSLLHKGERLLQPNNQRTYVVDSKGSFYVINSSDKLDVFALDTIALPFTKGEKVTDFTRLDDTTFVVTTNLKRLHTINTKNEHDVVVKTQENMGQKIDGGGGRVYGLDFGSLHELTPDGSGGWDKGPGFDAGGATDLAVDNSGTTVVTGGGSDVNAWDVSGAMPALKANRTVPGEFLAIAVGPDGQFWLVIDEYGSPLCEKWQLDCTAACVFALVASRYTLWLGPPKIATDPVDPSLVAIARGDGGELLQESAPQLTSLYSVAGLIVAHHIAIATILANPYLYVSGDVSGLWIWDMLDPAAPVLANSITFGFDPFLSWQFYSPSAANLSPSPMQSPYAVAAVGFGINMYDLSDPTDPAFVDQLFIGGTVHDLAVQGNYAYGAADALGLKIANLTTPTEMVLENTVATPSAALRVIVTADHAYVTTSADGVRIVDVAVAASASEVGSVTGFADVKGIATDGTYLYVGDDNTLYIYDLVDPEAPALVGSHDLSTDATVEDIGVVDVPPGTNFALSPTATKLAYVAGGPVGFVVIDISNVASPVELSTQASRDQATSVAVDGNDVYLGDGGAGFKIYEVDPTQVPVFIQAFDARVNGRCVDISWVVGADEDVVGLEVYRATASNHTPLMIHGEGSLASARNVYRDDTVESGRTYWYTLAVRTAAGEVFRSPTATVAVPPREAALLPNYPNPFNPSTSIAFDLPRPGYARLAIYDAAGRHVVTLVDGIRPAGMNELEWDGTNALGQPVGSGVYVARLQTDGTVQTVKLTLVK